MQNFQRGSFKLPPTEGRTGLSTLSGGGYFANRGQSNGEDERESLERAIPDLTTNPETLLASKQIQKIVQDAINDLDPDHKEIVILRDIEGFSYEEIAQMLGLPEGTTKSRLHRARMVVKEKLKKALS